MTTNTYKEGNIQKRSHENNAERLWASFAEDLQKVYGKGFTAFKGTSNASQNGLKEHMEARHASFDFIFKFKGWDSQIYENIPNFRLGQYTGQYKEFMWDYNYELNIAVKQVGKGSLASVMPYRYVEAFGVSNCREDYLIVDFNDILKLRNFGGILYIKEHGENGVVHHILGSRDILEAVVGTYAFDWEGDPNKVGGGGYKAKTLIRKGPTKKFETFEQVKDYIRYCVDIKLEIEKQTNRNLFRGNIATQETKILKYSDAKKGAKDPCIRTEEGVLKPAPQQSINCKLLRGAE